jgi:predicted O-linked N-acetylglucosamine transferase (SPINDLY family)
MEAYQALALDLARDPGKIASLKATLKNARGHAPLFDTDLFRRDFEAALTDMLPASV